MTRDETRRFYLNEARGNEREAMAAMVEDLRQGLAVTEVTEAVLADAGVDVVVTYARDAAIRRVAEDFGADVETVEAAVAAAEKYERGVD